MSNVMSYLTEQSNLIPRSKSRDYQSHFEYFPTFINEQSHFNVYSLSTKTEILNSFKFVADFEVTADCVFV